MSDAEAQAASEASPGITAEPSPEPETSTSSEPAEELALKIAAGIPFLELDPASFRCPVCRSKMGAFKDIGPRNKPSGFEENLNFGLGVNRLTPGQKNVLIFGGFALAVAFFLSLYSLR